MKVIRESYRAGESWPFFVTLERGEEIRGYFRVNYDALMALADEMDAYTECDDERCGKEMPPSTIHDFARRIRDALGVK